LAGRPLRISPLARFPAGSENITRPLARRQIHPPPTTPLLWMSPLRFRRTRVNVGEKVKWIRLLFIL
ncbi:hypothetical protein, partial [Actinoplanes octamycinicus]|uniref:hypothetical protein n=1 Tax=Actinoplanes octamycinicus TaxID=135948 RepID=UPI0035F07073